jgi:hypothetical protein
MLYVRSNSQAFTPVKSHSTATQKIRSDAQCISAVLSPLPPLV